MRRTRVSSSNLAEVGYDPETSILEIKFHQGGVYQYYNVPKSIYHDLMTAASKGRYHHQHIKNGPYRYRKVRSF